jgi:hypothetical protein
MALNWRVVTAHHVRHACEIVAKDQRPQKEGGLFVVFENRRLAAKAVAKIAYCIANDLPTDTQLKFSSGEPTLNLLRRLGFDASRDDTNRGA